MVPSKNLNKHSPLRPLGLIIVVLFCLVIIATQISAQAAPITLALNKFSIFQDKTAVQGIIAGATYDYQIFMSPASEAGEVWTAKLYYKQRDEDGSVNAVPISGDMKGIVLASDPEKVFFETKLNKIAFPRIHGYASAQETFLLEFTSTSPDTVLPEVEFKTSDFRITSYRWHRNILRCDPSHLCGDTPNYPYSPTDLRPYETICQVSNGNSPNWITSREVGSCTTETAGTTPSATADNEVLCVFATGNDCEGGGKCQNNQCVCNPGNSGVTCETQSQSNGAQDPIWIEAPGIYSTSLDTSRPATELIPGERYWVRFQLTLNGGSAETTVAIRSLGNGQLVELLPWTATSQRDNRVSVTIPELDSGNGLGFDFPVHILINTRPSAQSASMYTIGIYNLAFAKHKLVSGTMDNDLCPESCSPSEIIVPQVCVRTLSDGSGSYRVARSFCTQDSSAGELFKCPARSCGDHGTCSANGKCLCKSEWLGPWCDNHGSADCNSHPFCTNGGYRKQIGPCSGFTCENDECDQTCTCPNFWTPGPGDIKNPGCAKCSLECSPQNESKTRGQLGKNCSRCFCRRGWVATNCNCRALYLPLIFTDVPKYFTVGTDDSKPGDSSPSDYAFQQSYFSFALLAFSRAAGKDLRLFTLERWRVHNYHGEKVITLIISHHPQCDPKDPNGGVIDLSVILASEKPTNPSIPLSTSSDQATFTPLQVTQSPGLAALQLGIKNLREQRDIYTLVSRATPSIDLTPLHADVLDDTIYDPICTGSGCPRGVDPFSHWQEGTYPGWSKKPTPFWVWILVGVGSFLFVSFFIFLICCCCYRTQSCCWDPHSGFECCPGWHRPCAGCCKRCNFAWCTFSKPKKEKKKKKDSAPKYGGAQGGTLNPDETHNPNRDFESYNDNPYQNGYGGEQTDGGPPQSNNVGHSAQGGGYYY